MYKDLRERAIHRAQCCTIGILLRSCPQMKLFRGRRFNYILALNNSENDILKRAEPRGKWGKKEPQDSGSFINFANPVIFSPDPTPSRRARSVLLKFCRAPLGVCLRVNRMNLSETLSRRLVLLTKFRMRLGFVLSQSNINSECASGVIGSK